MKSINLKEAISKVLAVSLRALMKSNPAAHKILCLDSNIQHAEWLPASRILILMACLLRNLDFRHIRIKYDAGKSVIEDKDLVLAFMNGSDIQGINLRDATLYSVCCEREKQLFELSIADPEDANAIAKWCRIALHAQHQICSILDGLKPSRVVYIQGFLLECRILLIEAKKRGIEVIAWEFSASKKWIRVERIHGDAVFHPKIQEKSEISQRELNGHASVGGKYLLSEKISDHSSGDKHFVWPSDKTRVIVLLQVYTDASQILQASQSVNPVLLVRETLKEARVRNMFVLLKSHPKEVNGYTPLGKALNSLTHRKLLASGFPWEYRDGVDFAFDYASSYSTTEAISQSDIVVTVNSQGALDAALSGKEVIICAAAYFEDMGIITKIASLNELGAELDAIQEGRLRADPDRAADIVAAYFRRDCVPSTACGFAEMLRLGLRV